MGVRPQMQTLCDTNIYIHTHTHTTVSLPTSTASMSMDGRGMGSEKREEISLQCVQEHTFSCEGETNSPNAEREKSHKSRQTATAYNLFYLAMH